MNQQLRDKKNNLMIWANQALLLRVAFSFRKINLFNRYKWKAITIRKYHSEKRVTSISNEKF